MTGEVRLMGIRHHGPGSARWVVRALDHWQPDAVLVELPADCQPALAWVGDPDLVPPVALLGHVADHPHRASFSPLAEFSPEWQAFSWARARGAQLRAIDLPLTHVLAAAGDVGELPLAAPRGARPIDPLAALAAAAGDPEPERWWDDVVEHRGDTGGVDGAPGAPGAPGAFDPFDAFAAVAEAMAAVRDGAPPDTPMEARREAHMRRSIRQARSDGFERIAVVCGAWHVPALADPLPAAATDTALLRGLPKAKVVISWVPWTHRRLAAATGYGAGVRSPGWYAHVFAHPGEEGVSRWFVNAGRLLRDRGLQASPDHLIAAIRAATSLARLRNRPRPGLAEVLDAADTVMAGVGNGMSLLYDQLVVGDDIGTVPERAPQVPLARDLAVQQRKARLKPEAGTRTVELDLRTQPGRTRSVLLHRLVALGVPWGAVEESRGSSGTFRETWRLHWEPELTITLIELAGHGTTVEAAAVSRLAERAAAASALADLVRVLELGLLADLPAAVEPVVRRLAEQAAHDPDVARVIDTLEPLARTMRYGDVRGTDAASLRAVFDGLVVRVVAGIVGACRSLDEPAAAAMVERIAAAQAAMSLADHPARHAPWPAALAQVTERPDVHGLVQGRAARLLHDGGTWDRRRVGRRLSRALSGAAAPAAGAAFVEGFLAGSGTVLVHDAELLDVVDSWVSSLSPDSFIVTAPLLRRTFGSFEAAERRQLGQLLAHDVTPAATGFGDELDARRAAAAMATVRSMLSPGATDG